MDTRNTATLTTQKTSHGEAVLGGMLGEGCSLAADKAMVVWLSGVVMELFLRLISQQAH
jgi:hypothetical protein